MALDMLKRYRNSGFTLTMWDTHSRDWRGQTRIGYKLRDRGKVIFEGTDFAGSPMHADDSLQTVAALLSFLSLQKGDTDSEYFDKYTPEQLEWSASFRCEELKYIASRLEERYQ